MDMGDGEEFVLRPMNCPHHIRVFKHHVHSYRELPTVSPKSGWCTATRNGAPLVFNVVREMSLNDGHPCHPEQIQEESNVPFSWLSMFMKFPNLEWISLPPSFRLSRYSHKYFDNDEMWKMPKPCFVQLFDEMGVDYF